MTPVTQSRVFAGFAGRALDAIGLLALAVWLGGYATIGAVVAPLVFGRVPAPYSADAMTAVFRRFDAIAIVCAALALLVEAGHAALRARLIAKLDIARASLVGAAAVLAIYGGVVVSPHIERLHVEGAVRGSGPLGLELDSVHHTAERIAKLELALLLGALALYAFRPARDASPPPA
jgi:hypothetical protein